MSVYGFTGTRPDGVKVTMTGTPPSGMTNVQTYPDAASFLALIQPVPTAPTVDLVSYAKAKLAAVLATGKTFNVAPSGSAAVNVLCDGASETRADLAGLALFGQLYPTQTQTWVDNNSVSTVLTGTEFLALATAALAWIGAGYAALGTVLAGISASPATITTTAQIDMALGSF